MGHKIVAWSSLLFLLLALASPCHAQINRGTLEGTVIDPQGAFIPGVKVTVVAVDTNLNVPTTTNSVGYYRVVDLVPGMYQVHFTASGFSGLDMTDIVVPAGQIVRADGQLKLGATRQTMEVSASASMMQTAATDFATMLGSNTIQQLPLSGRDLQQLVFQVPGIIGNGPPGSSFGFNSSFGAFPDPTHVQGTGVSVNGGQIGANAWYLDGNFNLASGMAEAVVVNPSPDSVTDFQVITNGFSAEYGRSGGAVFNVIMKSGSNKLHGSLYEYNRNSLFNARNPFTSVGSQGQLIPQHDLRFNNFGGTLGGPVVIPHLYDGRNKTFFFLSWDKSILHLNGSGIFDVPTALERVGNFSEDVDAVQYGVWNPYSTVGPADDGTFARSAFGTPKEGSSVGCTGRIVALGDGSTTAVNPTSSDCNFSTQLPANMLSPTANYYLKSYPLPNYLNPLSGCPVAANGQTGICSNYLATLGSSQDQVNFSLKIDHQWSEKSRFFGEWLYNPGKYTDYRIPWSGASFPSGQTGYGSQVPLDFKNQIIALGNTYSFGPTLINEVRVSFTRQFYTTHPNQGGYPDSVTDLAAQKALLAPLNIPVVSPPGAPNWVVDTPGGGGLNFGPVPWSSNYTATESYTVLDNLTKIIGKHTLKTGFVYRLSHDAEFQSAATYLVFGGGAVVDPVTGSGGGAGLAAMEMGAVMNDGGSTAFNSWQPYLRYRYWGTYLQDDWRITPKFTLNLGLRYDIFGAYKTRQHPDSRFCYTCMNSYTGMPGLVQYEGDPGFPMNTDIAAPNFNDFGPRINFAYTPFSDSKTVIRGGYDVFYSNAYSAINGAQGVENAIGYTPYFFWSGSSNPAQCANFSGQCVSWNLDDTTADKGALTNPPFTTVFPAQNRDPSYAQPISYTPKPVHDPMVQNWTLQVQRELPGNMLLTVGYVGSHGTHLVSSSHGTGNYVSTANMLNYRNSINAVVPITDYYSGQTAQALAQIWGSDSLSRGQLLVANPAYANIGPVITFRGANVYHALQVRLQKRYSHGLNFNLAYTWSKNMADASTGSLYNMLIDPIHMDRAGGIGGLTGKLSGSSQGRIFQDPDNLARDYGVSFNDMTHLFNFSTTYELPFGPGRRFVKRKGLANLLLGGWQLTGNFNASSGVPLQITGPSNAMSNRPNMVGDPTAVPGGQTRDHWINAAAFMPVFGSDQNFWKHPDTNDDRWWQFGDAAMRLSYLRSPAFWNLDTALSKHFNVTESKYFEFRWEAFNALNHQNLALPNTGFCLPPAADGTTDKVHKAGCSFGRITNIQTDPRALQFALKFVF